MFTEDLDEPARALTIDQAFSRAYGSLRRMCLYLANRFDEEECAQELLVAVEHAAEKLEADLRDLLYSEPLANIVARPR